ncbi:LysR family transcriptional regulator [Lichenihabitans sp. Uapishka_5]|uniref:LysR family transcriptional regulator n=1 Tax=Lichenihabitans sp. Uapishka_5 TaxID=3037302 RepID=UPI0029E81339|nr:LysR family transcriptional regulator [Lichenihabitans sp. Uapishka_5]MDX7951474.1 LysR family transcriptional regulator [Lichenihabitans sp. Uapishka_5]
MDRLEAMALLSAAVEHGSFSAASRRLGVPLPTLSRKIADLEEHLDARLLLRSTRKLSLTEAGADYLAAARRILDQVDEAERAAAGEWRQPRGELVVTAPVVFGRLHVLPVVTAFLDSYPAVDVNLVLSDRNLGLLADHVDLAVRIGALPDSDLVATTIGHVQSVIVAAPSLLDRCGAPQHPDTLRDLPCIAYAGLSEARQWSFARAGNGPAMTVPIRPRLTVNTVEAGLDAAVAGLGFAQALSYQTAAAEAAGALRRVLQAHEGAHVPISLLHAGQGPLPLKTRTFLEFAAARLRAQAIS